MEEKIDLRKVVNVLKKNWKWLLFVPITLFIISMSITLFVLTPKYSASTQVLVNQKESDSKLFAQQVQSDLQLVNTYSEIINSPRILDEVSQNLKDRYSSEEILSMLTVNSQADSQILNIAITNEDSEEASIIANEVANVFKKDIKKIMHVDNVSVLSNASSTGDKVFPKTFTNGIVSIFLGVILALVIVFLKELLDRRIKMESDVEEILELPVLGTIQDFNQ